MPFGLNAQEWKELIEQQREFNMRMAGVISKMEPGLPGQILSTDDEGKPKWIEVENE